MTYGELHDYAVKQLKSENVSEIDWRPAGDFYIDDIVKIYEHEGKPYPTVPMGIRMWLNNGDSIIYVKAN